MEDSSEIAPRWEPPTHMFVQCLDDRHDQCDEGIVFMDACLALCSCSCHSGNRR